MRGQLDLPVVAPAPRRARCLLVGEMPSPTSDPDRPLHPTAKTSAGWRLMSFAGIGRDAFDAAFHRVNLVRDYHRRWPIADARRGAAGIAAELRAGAMGITRAVLLGSRVAAAFGIEPWMTVKLDPADGWSVELAAIPHPSGAGHAYNHIAAREAAGRVLRWGALDE